ncbi:MAG: hypothetical protein HY788_18180 [Deltaproteobacteria bacterium]|nr:hypothetical protein [Deltaproteobacteria bacterium]
MSRTLSTIVPVVTLLLLFGIPGFPPNSGHCSTETSVLHPGWNSLDGTPANAARAMDRGSRFTATESTVERLQLKVELPGMLVRDTAMKDGNTYTVVTAPGSGMHEVGGPDVPVYGTWILIPNGTRATVETEPGQPLVFDQVDLPPIQPPSPDVEDAPLPPFSRNEALYASDADYPGTYARLEATSVMRGQECAILRLNPFQYNPVRKTLSVYRDLVVTVRFDGTPSPIEQRLRTESFDKLMRGMAPNADAVLALGESEKKGIRKPSVEPELLFRAAGGIGWDYIIIAHSNFSEAAYKLAAWKEQIGFKVLTVPTPSPTAADIRNLIKWCYDTLDIAPSYVLLIGDAEFVPCDYWTEHPWDSYPGVTGDAKQGHIGTDLYYAAIDGNDYTPDLAIGRLSVGSATHALNHVDRIIEYEKDPPVLTTFYDDVAICAYFQDGVEGTPINPDGIEDARYTQTSEDLALFLSEAAYGINKTVTRIYYARPIVNPAYWNDGQLWGTGNFGGGPAGNPGDPIPAYLKRPGFAWDGDYLDIKGAFENGSFLITHRDHGGRQYWVQPYFHSYHIGSLQIRFGESPVVWSVNCKTGWFDNETDYSFMYETDYTGLHEESFAEFLESYCSFGGPVGIIAATRVTDTMYNARLVWGWTDAIWPTFIPTEGWPLWIFRMGDVLNSGKAYMATKFAGDTSGWVQAHFEMYHWFGDPSMEIRNASPGYLDAKHPAQWPWQNKPHDFKVHVQWLNGFPVWLARVTVSRSGAPLDQRVGWTDLNGDVVFADLVTSQLGEYTVTAVFPNAVPYIGTFQSSEFKPAFLWGMFGNLLEK